MNLNEELLQILRILNPTLNISLGEPATLFGPYGTCIRQLMRVNNIAFMYVYSDGRASMTHRPSLDPIKYLHDIIGIFERAYIKCYDNSYPKLKRKNHELE